MKVSCSPWCSFEIILEMRAKEKGKVLEKLRVTARVWRFKRDGFGPNGPKSNTWTLFELSWLESWALGPSCE